MHQCISSLYQRVNSGCADLALRLFVLCGQTADETGFEEVSYEFFAQAFTVYEDSISDSRAQFQAVCIISSALHGCRNFGRENYDTLITKAALHGSKLLKKPDQCRAVYLASHLWWVVESPQKEGDEPNIVSLFSLIPTSFYRIYNSRFYSCRFIVMVNVFWNAFSARFVWQMLAWILLYPWSSSSRY